MLADGVFFFSANRVDIRFVTGQNLVNFWKKIIWNLKKIIMRSKARIVFIFRNGRHLRAVDWLRILPAFGRNFVLPFCLHLCHCDHLQIPHLKWKPKVGKNCGWTFFLSLVVPVLTTENFFTSRGSKRWEKVGGELSFFFLSSAINFLEDNMHFLFLKFFFFLVLWKFTYCFSFILD